MGVQVTDDSCYKFGESLSVGLKEVADASLNGHQDIDNASGRHGRLVI